MTTSTISTSVSFSPAIQGLLVALNEEYEITNDAISFVNDVSSSLLVHITNKSFEVLQEEVIEQSKKKQRDEIKVLENDEEELFEEVYKARDKEEGEVVHINEKDAHNLESTDTVTSKEVQKALQHILPLEIARQAISEASISLSEYTLQSNEQNVYMREAISDFELIGNTSERKASNGYSGIPRPTNKREFISFSPDLILKFLSQQQATSINVQKIDKTGTIFLSSALEYFVTRLLDVVGHKSNPTLTKPAFQSVFEKGEIFHSLWVNLHPQQSPVNKISISSPEEHTLSDSHLPLPVSPLPPPMPPYISITESISPEPSLNIGMFVAPLLLFLGRACSGVDISARSIQIMSSLTEYLLRCFVSESSQLAQYKSAAAVSCNHLQDAIRRILPSELARDAIKYANENNLSAVYGKELLLVQMAAQPVWGSNFESGCDTYVASVLVYVVKRTLCTASSHARTLGIWVIRSVDMFHATESIFTSSSPIWKVIVYVRQRSVAELKPYIDSQLSQVFSLEGPILSPPSPARISAADKIYLTSIICETPLQPEYVFVFTHNDVLLSVRGFVVINHC